jgi:hypothetical protein
MTRAIQTPGRGCSASPFGRHRRSEVRLLRALPAKQRDVLLLAAWAESSYEEIAVALGLPLGTVRSRLSRARRRMLQALEAIDAGPDHGVRLTRRSLALALVAVAEAVARGSRLPAEPRLEQWIYQYGVEQSVGEPTQRTGSWGAVRRRKMASIVDGRLVLYDEKVPDAAFGSALQAYLADPTPPHAPRTRRSRRCRPIRTHSWRRSTPPCAAERTTRMDCRWFDVVPTATPGQREFQFIAQLLWQDSQSGLDRGAANVFQALSTLPGVTAASGITDALGRHAVALSDDGGRFQLLLSPSTYQVLGIRSVSTGDAPHLPNGGTMPKGTVVQSFAIADGFVAAPGQRR